MKNSIKKEKRRIYLLFSMLGIMSFFLGIFLGENILGLAGPSEICFILLTFSVLFAIGLYISKRRSPGFALKAFTISFITLFLIFCAFFMWGAHEHYHAKGITAHKLQNTPDEFVDITEDELDEFPALKEAIISQEPVKVHPDEWMRTIDFLNEKGSWFIRFNGEYYEILFITA